MNKIINFLAIRPKLRALLSSYFRDTLVFDIEFNLRMRALNSTCEYIEKNMVGVVMYEEKMAPIDHALKHVSIDGVFCEFGVYKGKSVNYIARRIKQEIHAFDSFEGLPETWLSTHKKGHFALNKLPSFEPNVVIHKGWFDETLPDFVKNQNEKIAFLHIDCDLYSSTKTIFNFLNQQIVEGTIILFDEYFNYPFWEQHEYKAFQEFVSEHNIEYEYLCYSSRTFGSKVAVKITRKGEKK
ncbi:MAG TPA: class I SAM-dependent methyltransferase [Brumimicrobium sp.]|nr:class I SAM-dependent methyltransferase [Brumimicrobium sp.]